jgi:hypothetical protein
MKNLQQFFFLYAAYKDYSVSEHYHQIWGPHAKIKSQGFDFLHLDVGVI